MTNMTENKAHSEGGAAESDAAKGGTGASANAAQHGSVRESAAAAVAAVPRLFTPAFWRSFAALSFVLVASSFMNVSVFPGFDAVFAYARDISVTANAVALIAIGLVATFRPALLRVNVLNAGALALLALGCTLPLALGLHSAVLLVVASRAPRQEWAVLLLVARAEWTVLLASRM